MRGCKAWVCALCLVGLVGCLRTFGPGGSIPRAIKKDQQAAQQQLPNSKSKLEPPAECPPENELEQLCEDPDDDWCPQECLEP